MPRTKTPKKYDLALFITVLTDRGTTTATMDGGWFRTIALPDIYRVTTEREGAFYLLATGAAADGKDADLAMEFDAATVIDAPRKPRAPKS